MNEKLIDLIENYKLENGWEIKIFYLEKLIRLWNGHDSFMDFTFQDIEKLGEIKDFLLGKIGKINSNSKQ